MTAVELAEKTEISEAKIYAARLFGKGRLRVIPQLSATRARLVYYLPDAPEDLLRAVQKAGCVPLDELAAYQDLAKTAPQPVSAPPRRVVAADEFHHAMDLCADGGKETEVAGLRLLDHIATGARLGGVAQARQLLRLLESPAHADVRAPLLRIGRKLLTGPRRPWEDELCRVVVNAAGKMLSDPNARVADRREALWTLQALAEPDDAGKAFLALLKREVLSDGGLMGTASGRMLLDSVVRALGKSDRSAFRGFLAQAVREHKQNQTVQVAWKEWGLDDASEGWSRRRKPGDGPRFRPA